MVWIINRRRRVLRRAKQASFSSTSCCQRASASERLSFLSIIGNFLVAKSERLFRGGGIIAFVIRSDEDAAFPELLGALCLEIGFSICLMYFARIPETISESFPAALHWFPKLEGRSYYSAGANAEVAEWVLTPSPPRSPFPSWGWSFDAIRANTSPNKTWPDYLNDRAWQSHSAYNFATRRTRRDSTVTLHRRVSILRCQHFSAK